MNICSDGHRKICFEERNCPFCEYIEEQRQLIDEMGKELSQKDDIIDSLRGYENE